MEDRIIQLIPSIGWLRRYPKAWLRLDVVAGLTAAAVVIPKAMAYATIAGLPVQVGLYTAFVPMVVYALLGTSRPLSVSTTTTLAILVVAELNRAAPSGGGAELLTATATLTILVGAMLVLASVLRFGFIANFISEPVLTGFKSGIGLVDRGGPDPQAAGRSYREVRFLERHPGHPPSPPADLRRHAGAGPGAARVDLRSGALRAARAGPTDCGRHRYRLLGSAGPA